VLVKTTEEASMKKLGEAQSISVTIENWTYCGNLIQSESPASGPLCNSEVVQKKFGLPPVVQIISLLLNKPSVAMATAKIIVNNNHA